VKEVIGGREHWSAAGAERPSRPSRAAILLPNYDEYLVAYRDRSAAIDPALDYDPSLFSFGSILSNVVLIGGRVRGSWRRTPRGAVEVRLLGSPGAAERSAVDRAVEKANAFFATAS